MLGISRVIDQRERSHWSGITKLINETPDVILRALWEYLITLATNQRDTYTDPFEIVTSNIGNGLLLFTCGINSPLKFFNVIYSSFTQRSDWIL